VVRLDPERPNELDRILRKSLEKDRDLRHQSARELLTDLKRLRRDTTSGASTAHVPRGSQATSALPSPRGGRRSWPWLAAALIVLAALAGWRLLRRPAAPAGPVSVAPFTADGGQKFLPSLSPDGERVAYTWDGDSIGNLDIYVKPTGPGTRPLRLTEHPGIDTNPVWSPDGRQIVFVRIVDNHGSLHSVPSLGGQERKLADVQGPATSPANPPLIRLAWAPDGRSIVFSEKPSLDVPAHILELPLDTLQARPMTHPPEDSFGDLYPSISPDGRQLAFVRSSSRGWGNQDVWVQPLQGGDARRLTNDKYADCWSLSWTPGGNEILYSFFTVGSRRMARVALAGGASQPIVGAGAEAHSGSIRGGRMVYVQDSRVPPVLYRVPVRAPSSGSRASEPVASNGGNQNPAYSPDGKKIAFESARLGVPGIWVSDADGSHPVQVSSFAAYSGTPRWSPDGRRLVFDSLQDGNWDIYAVEVDGGTPRRLTAEPSEDGTGTWSRDGRSIYFHSDRSGRFELWKMPSDGGAAVQLTRQGGFYGAEAADGRFVYYSKGQGGPLWRVPVDGGEETEIVQQSVRWLNWSLAGRSLYYAITQPLSLSLQRLDLETGRSSPFLQIETSGIALGVAVSPDEQWVLYANITRQTSELILVENFR
jgi:Tol biopolymer transport system component